MICPRCSHDITEGQTVCPGCRLTLSQVGASTAPSAQQQAAVKEQPPSGIISGGLAAIFVGVITFIMGGGGGIAFGLFCFACGIATLAFTRFGTRWNSLSGWQKALIWPGLAIGIVYIGGLRLAAAIIRAFV